MEGHQGFTNSQCLLTPYSLQFLSLFALISSAKGRKKKVCFPSQSESGFPYQMDHITLRWDNRDIPSLLCFSFSPHRTPAHSRSLSLSVSLRLSVLLFNSPFFSVAHRGGRRINQKSFEGEAEARRRRGGGEKRRGRAKSIPQVNLRPEIFYTINKQGESGDWMREGTVGGGRGAE